MNRLFAAGIALSALGVAGYAAGMAADYPGRAFSITALMVGITLVGVHDVGREDEG